MNYFYFILLASFWGGSFIAIQRVVMQIPPFFGAFLRVFFSSLFLLAIFFVMRKSIAIPIRQAWKSWFTGLFSLGIPFSFLFWGERFISPGLAAILNATVPIMTFLLAIFYTKGDEPFTWNKCFGVFLGILGTVIIFYPKLTLPGHYEELWGTAALLCMSIAYAIGIILNRIILRSAKITPHANLVHQNFSSSIYLLLIFLLFEPVPQLGKLMHVEVILSVVYLALFSTAIAFIIFFHLIQTWGSLKASMVTYIAPLMTIMLDFILNHNVPQTHEVFGACSILLGILFVQYGKVTEVQLQVKSEN